MKIKAIEFRVKTYAVIDNDVRRQAFSYKKIIGRSDCNLTNSDHAYYNSDLFPAILNRAYRKIIGEHSSWTFIDQVPAGVIIDTSKFLATVTILLPESFR